MLTGSEEEVAFDVARRLAYPVPAEKEWEPTDVYTPREEMILCWTARIAGLISFLSGLYMFVVAWRHRWRNVFHRLMLGTFTVGNSAMLHCVCVCVCVRARVRVCVCDAL